MSRMEALRSYTINAAYAGFDEAIKGSLASASSPTSPSFRRTS